MSILIMLALIPAFISGLSSTIFTIPPRLQQDIGSLQKNQVITSASRLCLVSLTVFVFPWAFLAILASGIPQIWSNIQLRKVAAKYTDWNQNPDPAVREKILAIVKRILPGSIYYRLSSQITI